MTAVPCCARGTVLMPEWQTGTCAHVEVFLGQSSASKFHTACMQQIIAAAGAGPRVPGPLMAQPPSYTLGWKVLWEGYIMLFTQLVSQRSCVQEVIFCSLVFPFTEMSGALQSAIDFTHIANDYFYSISLIGLSEQWLVTPLQCHSWSLLDLLSD